MSRARGANAILALAFESSYGVPPGSGFFKLPFVSSQIGDAQDLVASNLLGLGRDPAAPSLDVINNTGDAVVPVDVRNFGKWLKLHFGAPSTTQGTHATGKYSFTANPSADDVLTVNGVDFTFKASSPAADEILIGSTLADSIRNAVRVLNASDDSDVTPASYSANVDGKTLDVTYDALGTGGNSFTLAKTGTAISVSGATLAGGGSTGPYNHVFASGASSLPSASIEIGNPEVPAYAMNYGIASNKLAIQMSRGGLLDATLSLIAQGELPNASSTATGSPTELVVQRFTQFSGSVTRGGVPLGDLVSGNFNCENGLDPVEVIRGDGRIGGIDPGEAAYNGQAVLRFKDTELLDLATAGTPVDLTHSWSLGASKSLQFVFHEVYLPRPKRPISGPGGIQMTYDWQGAKNATAGRAATVTLVNDVASY